MASSQLTLYSAMSVFGPFLKLPVRIQKRMAELLYYIPTLQEVLLKAVAECCAFYVSVSCTHEYAGVRARSPVRYYIVEILRYKALRHGEEALPLSTFVSFMLSIILTKNEALEESSSTDATNTKKRKRSLGSGQERGSKKPKDASNTPTAMSTSLSVTTVIITEIDEDAVVEEISRSLQVVVEHRVGRALSTLISPSLCNLYSRASSSVDKRHVLHCFTACLPPIEEDMTDLRHLVVEFISTIALKEPEMNKNIKLCVNLFTGWPSLLTEAVKHVISSATGMSLSQSQQQTHCKLTDGSLALFDTFLAQSEFRKIISSNASTLTGTVKQTIANLPANTQPTARVKREFELLLGGTT